MQSLDRAGKLGSARTSVRDSECGVPDSGFKGAVIFQKIRDTRRPEGVRGVVSWESDKKSRNARKTSYSTDVGVLPSVRENLSVLPFRHVPIGARVQAHWSSSWLALLKQVPRVMDHQTRALFTRGENFPHPHLVGRIGDQQLF